MTQPLPHYLGKKREQADYKHLSRFPVVNHLHTEQVKSEPGHKILDFITKRFWSWIYYYLKSRFGRNYPYPAYIPPDTGIYSLNEGNDHERVTIALVADWATNTRESIQIAQKIAAHDPDYTIHLGDTYYVGATHEIENNFLVPEAPWYRGRKGSFALLGNHEMYAQGESFFRDLLPTLGPRNGDTGEYGKQKAGFFCLENEYWRILGLDTGYHSVGKIPVIELIFPPDCSFDRILLDWLQNTVRLNDGNDKRGLVILTHHQYITAFKDEKEYFRPAQQLADLIGSERPVIWLWGHEHKFSVFQKAKMDKGVTAYGRCIGHGGMPVELKDKSFEYNDEAKGASYLVAADTRQRSGTNDYPLGHNGYALLKIERDLLTIGYYDEEGLLLEEQWKTDALGIIRGQHVQAAPCFEQCRRDDKSWDQLIT
jgi:hypothetical protein